MNEISINVIGYTAQGKTTVTALIVETLKAAGFNVEVTNVLEALDLEAIAGRDNKAVATILAERTNIKINTTTLNRPPTSAKYFQEV